MDFSAIANIREFLKPVTERLTYGDTLSLLKMVASSPTLVRLIRDATLPPMSEIAVRKQITVGVLKEGQYGEYRPGSQTLVINESLYEEQPLKNGVMGTLVLTIGHELAHGVLPGGTNSIAGADSATLTSYGTDRLTSEGLGFYTQWKVAKELSSSGYSADFFPEAAGQLSSAHRDEFDAKVESLLSENFTLSATLDVLKNSFIQAEVSDMLSNRRYVSAGAGYYKRVFKEYALLKVLGFGVKGAGDLQGTAELLIDTQNGAVIPEISGHWRLGIRGVLGKNWLYDSEHPDVLWETDDKFNKVSEATADLAKVVERYIAPRGSSDMRGQMLAFSQSKTDPYDVPSTVPAAEVELLPANSSVLEIIACGSLDNFSVAMAQDEKIRGLVDALKDCSSYAQTSNLIEKIIEQWAGSSGLVKNNASDFMDPRHKLFVEEVRGGVFTPEELQELEARNPTVSAANQIESFYQSLKDYIFGMVAGQSSFVSLWGVGLDALGKIGAPDYTLATDYFSYLATTDMAACANQLAAFGKSIKGLALRDSAEYQAFKESLTTGNSDFRHILDFFDGTNGAATVYLGSSSQNSVIAPTAAGGNYIFGFVDGGGIKSAGRNTLIGEVGYTHYVTGAGDTVQADSQTGEVWFKGEKLTGGQWNSTTQQFESPHFSYKLSGTDSTAIIVTSLQDATQTITLTKAPIVLDDAGKFHFASGYLDLNLNTKDVADGPISTINVALATADKSTDIDSSIRRIDFWMAWASGYGDRTNLISAPGTYKIQLTDVDSTAQYHIDRNGDLIVQAPNNGKVLTIRDALNPQNGDRLESITFADGVTLALGQLITPPQIGLPDTASVSITDSVGEHIARAGLNSTYQMAATGGNKVIDSFKAELSSQDQLVFDSSVSVGDLAFNQDGDDLLVFNAKKGSTLRVTGFMSADIDPSLAKEVSFADGTSLSYQQVYEAAAYGGFSESAPLTAADVWKLVWVYSNESGIGYALDTSYAEEVVLQTLVSNHDVGLQLAKDFYKSLEASDAKGLVDRRVFREHILQVAPADGFAFDVATQPAPFYDHWSLQNSSYQASGYGEYINGGNGNTVTYGSAGNDTINLANTQSLAVVQSGAGDDTLWTSAGLNTIVDAGNGNDYITTSYNGKAFVNAGAGNDFIDARYIFGGPTAADTTLFFSRGFGDDVVQSAPGVQHSRILFDSGIYQEDTAFKKFGNDLVIQMKTESSSITVLGYFAPGNSAARTVLNTVEFADGTKLGFDDVLAEAEVVDPTELVLAITQKMGLAREEALSLMNALPGGTQDLPGFVATLAKVIGPAATPPASRAFNLLKSIESLDAAADGYSLRSLVGMSQQDIGLTALSDINVQRALLAESPIVLTPKTSAFPPAYGGIVSISDMPQQYWEDRAALLFIKVSTTTGVAIQPGAVEQRQDAAGNYVQTLFTDHSPNASGNYFERPVPHGSDYFNAALAGTSGAAPDTIQFTGGQNYDYVLGGDGNDHLYGSQQGFKYLNGGAGDDFYASGAGGAIMEDGAGYNVFYARGGDTITNLSGLGALELSSAIDPASVSFRKDGDNLRIRTGLADGKDIVVTSWFAGDAQGTLSGGIFKEVAGEKSLLWAESEITEKATTTTFTLGAGNIVGDAFSGLGTLRLAAGISPNNLLVLRKGNDLILDCDDGVNSVVYKGWFSGQANQLKQAIFSDGRAESSAALSGAAMYLLDQPDMNGVIGNNGVFTVPGKFLLRSSASNQVLNGNSLPAGSTIVYEPLHPGVTVNRDYSNPNQSVLVDEDVGAKPIYAYGSSGLHLKFKDAASSRVTMKAGQWGQVTFNFADTGTSLTLNQALNTPNQSIEFADGVTMDDDAFRDMLAANTTASEHLLIGSSRNNTLIGGDGADFLYGGGGTESLIAGAGDDYIFGGWGPTTIDAGAGNDTVTLGRGDTVVDAGSGTNFLAGGLAHSETYLFGKDSGVTKLSLWKAVPGSQNILRMKDGVTTGEVSLSLVTSAANSADQDLVVQIKGSDAKFVVSQYTSTWNSMRRITSITFEDGTTWDQSALAARTGTAGADTLSSAQAMTFKGGASNDTITGSSGNDTYLFGIGDGHDTVTTSGGADSLVLGQNVLGHGVTAAQTAEGLVVQVDTGESVLFSGATAAAGSQATPSILMPNGQILTASQVWDKVLGSVHYANQLGNHVSADFGAVLGGLKSSAFSAADSLAAAAPGGSAWAEVFQSGIDALGQGLSASSLVQDGTKPTYEWGGSLAFTDTDGMNKWADVKYHFWQDTGGQYGFEIDAASSGSSAAPSASVFGVGAVAHDPSATPDYQRLFPLTGTQTPAKLM